MNYFEFKKYVEANAAKYLPGNNGNSQIKVTVETRIEDGEKRDVIQVFSGGSLIGTAMYLDKYYKDFLEGQSFDSILRNIAAMSLQIRQMDLSMGSIKSENAPLHLFCTILNAEKNRQLLETVPYEPLEDLAVICRWMVSRKKKIFSSFVMTREIMESMDLTVDQMFRLARENTIKQLKPTLEAMDGRCETPVLSRKPISLNVGGDFLSEPDENLFFILSNEFLLNGATSIIFTDLLSSIADYLGGDYYILPSSIHEVFVIPAKGQKSHVLKQIITEVNQECVYAGERLSDNVYYYSVMERRFKIAGE